MFSNNFIARLKQRVIGILILIFLCFFITPYFVNIIGIDEVFFYDKHLNFFTKNERSYLSRKDFVNKYEDISNDDGILAVSILNGDVLSFPNESLFFLKTHGLKDLNITKKRKSILLRLGVNNIHINKILNNSNESYYFLFIGPFNSEKRAIDTCNYISKFGYKSIVITVKP